MIERTLWYIIIGVESDLHDKRLIPKIPKKCKKQKCDAAPYKSSINKVFHTNP